MYSQILALALCLPAALACVAKNNMPKPSETVSSDAPIEVPARTAFDGKNKRYDRRNYTCKNQQEGGWSLPLVRSRLLCETDSALRLQARPILFSFSVKELL